MMAQFKCLCKLLF